MRVKACWVKNNLLAVHIYSLIIDEFCRYFGACPLLEMLCVFGSYTANRKPRGQMPRGLGVRGYLSLEGNIFFGRAESSSRLGFVSAAVAIAAALVG
mgnify:CR=1 FL=1